MSAIFSIDADLLKKSVSDLGKFLGGKSTNIRAILSEDGLVLIQSSPVAAAKINIPSSSLSSVKVKGTVTAVFDQEWIKSSLKKTSKGQNLKITFTDTTTKMNWPGCETSIANSSTDDISGPSNSGSSARPLPSQMIEFIRKYSSVLRLKTHFSTRPLAATIGTYKSRPFIMVNDQYHGVIIIDNHRMKDPFESFSLDSSAMAAIMFDPSSVETSSMALTIAEGRIFISYTNAQYEVPSFEPSAVPTQEEISQLELLAKSKNNSHRATLDTEAFADALSISRYGENPSQTFYIKKSKEGLDCVYASASVNSKGSIKGNIEKWPTPVDVDPNMVGDIVDQLVGQSRSLKLKDSVLLKKASRIHIKKSETGNVVVFVHGLFADPDYPSIFGFSITR